jgi:hypothetical protein
LERFQPQGRTSSGLYFGRLPPSSTIFFHHRFSFNFYNSSCVAKNTSLPQVEGAEGGKEERWRGNMQTLDSAQIWRRNTAQKFKRFDPRARRRNCQKWTNGETIARKHKNQIPSPNVDTEVARKNRRRTLRLSLSLSLALFSQLSWLLTNKLLTTTVTHSTLLII